MSYDPEKAARRAANQSAVWAVERNNHVLIDGFLDACPGHLRCALYDGVRDPVHRAAAGNFCPADRWELPLEAYWLAGRTEVGDV